LNFKEREHRSSSLTNLVVCIMVSGSDFPLNQPIDQIFPFLESYGKNPFKQPSINQIPKINPTFDRKT